MHFDYLQCSFAAGRFISILVSVFLVPDKMLFVNLVGDLKQPEKQLILIHSLIHTLFRSYMRMSANLRYQDSGDTYIIRSGMLVGKVDLNPQESVALVVFGL